MLTSVQNQELVSYSWIFPNVVTNGHWWYSNIPAYIAHDARARLQAVPKTKQIGYYSDAYKLEFCLPKYNMYRRILAQILADDFVRPGVYTETQAIALARLLLRENAERIFGLTVMSEARVPSAGRHPRSRSGSDEMIHPWQRNPYAWPSCSAAAGTSLQSLLDRSADGRLNAQVVAVISNNATLSAWSERGVRRSPRSPSIARKRVRWRSSAGASSRIAGRRRRTWCAWRGSCS